MPGASFRIVVVVLQAGGDLAVDVHRRVLEQGRWAATAARAGYRRRRGSWVAASHQPSRPPATRPTSGQGWWPGCWAVISKPTKAPIAARLSTSTILMAAHLPVCGAGWPGSLPAPGEARGRLQRLLGVGLTCCETASRSSEALVAATWSVQSEILRRVAHHRGQVTLAHEAQRRHAGGLRAGCGRGVLVLADDHAGVVEAVRRASGGAGDVDRGEGPPGAFGQQEPAGPGHRVGGGGR